MNEFVIACNGKSRIVNHESWDMYVVAHDEKENYSVNDVFTISDIKGRCMTYRKISDGSLFLENVHGMYIE